MFQHLPNAELMQLWQASIQLGLATRERRSVLLGSLDPAYVAGLPELGDPAGQLLKDLQAFNREERLADGSVPLLQWLHIGTALTSGRSGADPLVDALDRLSGQISGQPPVGDDLPEVQEKIVHHNDLLPVGFLDGARRAAVAVARASVPRFDGGAATLLPSGNPAIYNGSGWLITGDLWMTNHHVLEARGRGEAPASDDDFRLQAEGTALRFDYDSAEAAGTEASVAKFEARHRGLDYAVLRLAADSGRRRLTLAPAPLRPSTDERVPVNIVQHPEGGPKQIAIRNNLVTAATAKDLRYFTDTQSGSSGSPVCDDQWRVVALHRSSKAVRGVKFQGKSTAWVNVGTQIHAILDHLQEHYSDLWDEIRQAQNGEL